MCGRYALWVPLSKLVDAFDIPDPDFDFQPCYNIAPSQVAPIVAQDGRGRRMGLLRWGLIPSWAKDQTVGSRMINARSETVSDKPAFRSAFLRRRCLVPANGFFEWKEIEKAGAGGKTEKVPFWIHSSGPGPLAFAGLWERWVSTDGDPIHTFTILTTEASEAVSPFHHRMPVILPPNSFERWLAPGSDPETLRSLLLPYQGCDLKAHAVSTFVNSPRNDSPDCVAPMISTP